MQAALELLNELSESDIDWIFSAGREQQVIANTVIIREGDRPEALYIVIEGLLGVALSSTGDMTVGVLGPGAIIGELSFLEDRPAAASVTAIESSLLLVLAHTTLDGKLKDDPAFAARFYRALAILSSQRLRERVDVLGRLRQDQFITEHPAGIWVALEESIDQFKELLVQADREALNNDNVLPEASSMHIQQAFRDLGRSITSAIGDPATNHTLFNEELGARLRREILPYLLLTNTGERYYSKPRGYAGDFLTIEMIYRNQAEGSGRLGAVLDQCFLNLQAAVAVRNRRDLLAEEIAGVVEQRQSQVAHIASLACGPAAELFDVFQRLPDPARLSASLIDIDMQALAFVADRRDKAKLQRQMHLINANLMYLATGRQKIDLKEQDLIYSIGLIDYFNDKFVIKLLNYIYGLLHVGGKVILGNFHPRNPDKALMDYVLDWKLIHRTEADMDRLFSNSTFNRPCTNVRFEEQGINLFAECIKA